MINIDHRNFNELTSKARSFFEQSDQYAWRDLFGRCNTIEEINEIAEDLYDDFFGEDDEEE